MNAFNPGVAVVAGVGPGLGASLARKCAKEGVVRPNPTGDGVALVDQFIDGYPE
jgi:hypothetical protein